MKHVLDEELLTGTAEAQVHLRPNRQARLVDVADYAGTCAHIEQACQLWGGANDILVPVRDQTIPDEYVRLLANADLDSRLGCEATNVPSCLALARAEGRTSAILPLVVSDRSTVKAIQVDEVPGNDPWHAAYVATFGILPRTPNAALLASSSLKDDLTFEDVHEIRFESSASPGAEHLLSRLSDSSVASPIAFSLHGLTPRPIQSMSSAALDGWLMDRGTISRQSSSDIIVLYAARSVSDLCLLWNLRTAHGRPLNLPLGIPVDTSQPNWIEATTEAVTVLAGLSLFGWRVFLMSSSLTCDELEGIGESVRATGIGVELASSPSDLLTEIPASCRVFSAAPVFENGEALVPTRDDSFRREFPGLGETRFSPKIIGTVTLDRRPLPPRFVEPDASRWSPRYSGSGCVLDARRDELRRIAWPTGWTVLRSLMAAQGVAVTPSSSGVTAMALLRAVGSLSDIGFLAHRPLIQLLYEKASSSGMSWWKRRSAEQARVVAEATQDPEAAVVGLLQAIESVSVSHGGETAGTIVFGDLTRVLGGTASARLWLTWAEERGLLVRGATLKCAHCQYRNWRPLAAITSLIVCEGCGRRNDRPFDETALPFSYRLGEVLRRTIENDSLYHLFVMRTLVEVVSDGPVGVVGGYPGVDMEKDGERAEADVLLLLESGECVPVEVKARSSGIRPKDDQLLDKIAGWLDSPAEVFGTGDCDEELSENFLALARTSPSPVRRLVTADDWLAPHLFVTFASRYPGPDVCQDRENPPAREQTAEGYETAFGEWLRRVLASRYRGVQRP
jgi:hypothetical protein